ncbi:UDP-glycosyltransferase 90A1-like [Malus domestica]|uniref:UDP-glycosyltransferase 90A1-like n=1 Tax=Malus domestica TaxID=3750 RepID=UPI0039764808
MSVVAAARNYGMMVSGFYELEPVFTDYWNTECGPKRKEVGFCTLSQAELSAEQIQEIALGLENSMVNFLWVIRSKEYSSETATWDIKGFEKRVNGRGMMVKQWVDQKWILMHESVQGFEVKVGARVETCDGSTKRFVKSEGMEKMVKELMEGEMGKEARREAKELAVVVRKAVSEGGSSWSTLQLLIDETTCDKNTS